MAQNPDPITSHSIITNNDLNKNINECILCISFPIILIAVIWVIHYQMNNIRPYDHIRVLTTDGTITQFDYTNNTILYYNLALNFTISNIVHSYDYVEASALYQDAVFGYSILQQMSNNSINELHADFKGYNEGLSLNTNQILEENMSGVFHIIVKLCLRLRHDPLDGTNPLVRCELHVPLESYKEGHGFHATQCDVRGSSDIQGNCSIQ